MNKSNVTRYYMEMHPSASASTRMVKHSHGAYVKYEDVSSLIAATPQETPQGEPESDRAAAIIRMFRGAIMAPTLAEIEVCRAALEIHHAEAKSAIPQELPPHDACENSRDCIACGTRIAPSFGVCFHCHVTKKPILEAQLPSGRYPIPQDLPCGYCSKPIDGRPVCGECWRDRTSRLEGAVAEKLAAEDSTPMLTEAKAVKVIAVPCTLLEEVAIHAGITLPIHLARQITALIDATPQGLPSHDACHGDYHARACRIESGDPTLTEAEAGEVIRNSSQSYAPITQPRRFTDEERVALNDILWAERRHVRGCICVSCATLGAMLAESSESVKP
jgi:hypothetical protein